MRPPHPRNFVGVAAQERPHLGTPSVCTPAPKTVHRAVENKDSIMTHACIQGHEKIAMPLREVNRNRGLVLGDYSRHAPRPKLARRPNEMAPILVKTFE